MDEQVLQDGEWQQQQCDGGGGDEEHEKQEQRSSGAGKRARGEAEVARRSGMFQGGGAFGKRGGVGGGWERVTRVVRGRV